MIRRICSTLLAFALLVAPALSAWVGFKDASSQAVIVQGDSSNVGASIAQLADGRYIATWTRGQFLVGAGASFIVYKITATPTTAGWASAPLNTLYTPPVNQLSGWTNVAVTSDGYVVVTTQNEAIADVTADVGVIIGTVSGTTGGTFNDGITWGGFTLVTNSAALLGGGGVYTSPTKILELSPGNWMLSVYGGPSVWEGVGAYFTSNHGTTWGNGTVLIPSNQSVAGVAYNEAAFVLIPDGYANAGRIYGMIRQSYPDPGGGYALIYCDGDPKVSANWSSPQVVIPWPGSSNETIGRPAFVFVPKGSGYFVFIDRFMSANPGTAYTVASDPTSWQPIKRFGQSNNPNGVIQYWYAGAGVDSNNDVFAAISNAYANDTSKAWIMFDRFTVTP